MTELYLKELGTPDGVLDSGELKAALRAEAAAIEQGRLDPKFAVAHELMGFINRELLVELKHEQCRDTGSPLSPEGRAIYLQTELTQALQAFKATVAGWEAELKEMNARHSRGQLSEAETLELHGLMRKMAPIQAQLAPFQSVQIAPADALELESLGDLGAPYTDCTRPRVPTPLPITPPIGGTRHGQLVTGGRSA